MILGTGIDLLKISRVKKVHDKYGELFEKKILSEDEIKKKTKISLTANKLAKFFATKEAFVKALGSWYTKNISFKGSYIITQNDLENNCLVKSNIANTKKIITLGISIFSI